MRGILIILFALAVSATAGEAPIFDMEQYADRATIEAATGDVRWVEVSGIKLSATNADAEAVAWMNLLAADPDFFGDSGKGELAYDAWKHMPHSNAEQCSRTLVGSHRSKKTPVTEWIELEEDMDGKDNNKYLPMRFVLACKSKAKANQLEAKIKEKFPGKNWKERKAKFKP